MSFNLAVLIGNVTRDPEVKQVSSGKTVAKFSLATNEKWRDRQGQTQSKTEYHNVVIWGALSAIAFKIRKGDQVTVFGQVKTRSWESNDGQKKYTTEIVADRIVLGNEGSDENEVDIDF